MFARLWREILEVESKSFSDCRFLDFAHSKKPGERENSNWNTNLTCTWTIYKHKARENIFRGRIGDAIVMRFLFIELSIRRRPTNSQIKLETPSSVKEIRTHFLRTLQQDNRIELMYMWIDVIRFEKWVVSVAPCTTRGHSRVGEGAGRRGMERGGEMQSRYPLRIRDVFVSRPSASIGRYWRKPVPTLWRSSNRYRLTLSHFKLTRYILRSGARGNSVAVPFLAPPSRPKNFRYSIVSNISIL